jgi:hypothetical protein
MSDKPRREAEVDFQLRRLRQEQVPDGSAVPVPVAATDGDVANAPSDEAPAKGD